MNSLRYISAFSILLLATIMSCGKKEPDKKPVENIVPVTLTKIDTVAIESYIDLNATTSYLVKNTIKANTTGYVEKVNVASNDFVKKGQVLFSLQTREAKVLGNTINKIDPNLHFGNAISIRATSAGYASAVNVQQGDYVQEGDALAIINDGKSFSIVLSLPYALRKFVELNKTLTVYLPDQTAINAKVQSFMPTVDSASQTQNVILKYTGTQNIPENLVVNVRIKKTSGNKTISLPKSAVLSDETETDFWIMKMINADMAVKTPVTKGTENGDRIEIVSPKLKASDRVLLTGNYGVADTIKVSIKNKP